MFSALQIANFKAFGPAQEIPLRPITLVFGPNSAGKSSIIQSLLLARHIHDTGKPDAHQTTLGGAAVDLGGFEQYVRNHDSGLQTSIQFAFKRGEKGRRFHYLDNFQTLRITYAIGKGAPSKPSTRAVIQSATIGLDDWELLHFVRSETGKLHVDEAALSERSLFACGGFWMVKVLRQLVLSDLLDDPKPLPLPKHRVTLSEDEQRHKDAILIELREMSFSATSLAFENLNRVWDVNPYDDPDDTPEGDPFRFFKKYSEFMPGETDDASNPLGKTRIEAKAWAMALRYDIECLVEAASNAVQGGLRNVSYLGPLRWMPPRLIPEGEQFDASWTAGGGDAWQRLRREPELLEQVNRFLQDTLQTRYRLQCRQLAPELDSAAIERCVKRVLESNSDASAESSTADPDSARVAEDSPASVSTGSSASDLASALRAELRAQNSGKTLAELAVVNAESGLTVSHRDVGTGISQLLPVLVNAAGAKNQLIAIEQPELHLHPALQAELGDVFIESALGENKNTFLIETHSEHLILRLLRRVREATEGVDGAPTLRPDDICVLFVQPGKDGSEVLHLPVTPNGDFDQPWPGGFFAERAAELF